MPIIPPKERSGSVSAFSVWKSHSNRDKNKKSSSLANISPGQFIIPNGNGKKVGYFLGWKWLCQTIDMSWTSLNPTSVHHSCQSCKNKKLFECLLNSVFPAVMCLL